MRFSKSEEYRNQVWKTLCNNHFSKIIHPESQVLDVGAGWGEFINNITAAKKYAMDLNPDTAMRLSQETHFIRQDCSQTWQIESESLDVVFTSNFLEHLACKADVGKTIAEAYRCLKKNGIIICLGPNAKYVLGRYWDFWDHSIPITELSLSELLKLNGFNIQSCIPRYLPYSMSTGFSPPLLFLKIYLECKFMWPVLGKQFLIIARK